MPFIASDGCCRVCGREVESLKGDFLCGDCGGVHAPCFDAAASALRFEGTARDMVLDFKFNRHFWLKDDFSDWLEAKTRTRFGAEAIDAIIPMPSTLFHRLDRGFNQCALLARELARRFDRRYEAGVLRRKGHPKRQAGLSEEARRANAEDSFSVRHPERIRGRTLLLVDDIMTTGATLSAAAKALKECGAVRVWCVTIARSLRTTD